MNKRVKDVEIALAVPLSMGLEILSVPDAVFLGKDISKSKTSSSVQVMWERVGGDWGELDGKFSLSGSNLEKTLAKKLLNSSHLDKVDSAHAFP